MSSLLTIEEQRTLDEVGRRQRAKAERRKRARRLLRDAINSKQRAVRRMKRPLRVKHLADDEELSDADRYQTTHNLCVVRTSCILAMSACFLLSVGIFGSAIIKAS